LFVGPTSFVCSTTGGRVHPVHPSVDRAVAMKVQASPIAEVPEGAWSPVYQRLQRRLRASGVMLPSRASLGLPELAVPTFAVRIDGSAFDLRATLEATYDTGTVVVPPGAQDEPSAADGARNEELERAAAQRVLDAGLV